MLLPRDAAPSLSRLMTTARLAAAAAALLLAVPAAAQSPAATPAPKPAAPAAEGKWMVRVRALSLQAANQSAAIPSLSVPADAITVSDKIFPEVDVTYFVTPHLAAELVLTYPQQHDVKVAGTKIGTFKHLPPTLLAQWHFLPTGVVRPYVGAGVNLTLISDVNLAVPGVGALDLGKTSVGVAGQVGADVKLTPKTFLNLDVKKVQLGTDVKAGGTKVSSVDVNPWLLSAGVGFRF